MMSSIAPREQVQHQITYVLTTKEIASKSYVNNHAIISVEKKLLEKLGGHNVTGLKRRAFETGILSIPSLAVS